MEQLDPDVGRRLFELSLLHGVDFLGHGEGEKDAGDL